MPMLTYPLPDEGAVAIETTRHLTDEEFDQMVELLTLARKGFVLPAGDGS